MQNLSPVSGVSLLLAGDFLQLSPANQKCVFMKPTKGSYRSFHGWLWGKLQLFDQAQLLDRFREGQQTNNDLFQMKALANTDTAT